MNREQAKIIGQMSERQLSVISAVSGKDYKRWAKEIRAFGDGQIIESRPVGGVWCATEFLSIDGDFEYRIATPKITFNGVEIDAPIKDYESAPDYVWLAASTLEGHIPVHVERSSPPLPNFSAGRVFATKEACELYCDQHNKMMGIGE